MSDGDPFNRGPVAMPRFRPFQAEMSDMRRRLFGAKSSFSNAVGGDFIGGPMGGIGTNKDRERTSEAR